MPSAERAADLLESALGASRLLARPGDPRLWLLDAPAAVLWDLHAHGLRPSALADLLATRFGLEPARARAQVTDLIGAWRHAGLLGSAAVSAEFQAAEDPPAPARLTPHPRGAWWRWVADRAVSLACDAPAVADLLAAWFGPPAEPAAVAPVAHRLRLRGPVEAWRLSREDVTLAEGECADAALLAMLDALTRLGCRPAERLLVLHGAGLVTPDGRGLLLIAPGGSGKSTLTAALDTAGYGVLSDDLVPVTPDGDLLGLGLPLCLKAGSWPVLDALRPDLSVTPVIQRYGQRVRFLRPRTPVVTQPVTPALILLIRYQPAQPARVEALRPEQSLQGLLGAEAVVRGLTQDKLDRLARWVSAVPAYRLCYPDLRTAREQVTSLITDSASRPGA